MPNAWDNDPVVSTKPKRNAWDADPIVSQDAQIEAPVQRAATVGENTNAAVTGLNRTLPTLAGMPVDTALNVVDLLKAGAGSAYMGATGDSPPQWMEPQKRDKYFGSSSYLERKMRENGAGGLITPVADTPSTRILHSMGLGVGTALTAGRITGAPATNGAMARTAFGGGASGAAGATATEMGAPPEIAILAGMAPQMASIAATGGLKRMVRGNEQGRQAMAQRMTDLEAAGISNPSLGLASGNSFIAGLENLASKIPGSVGLYEAHRAKMIDGMANKAASARDAASKQYGSEVAGRAIETDLQTLLKPRITDAFERVNDKMIAAIPADKRFPIPYSLGALAQATAVNPLAPNTTAGFVQPRIATLRQSMLADSQATQANQYYPSTVNKGLPVSATRAIRTSIGNEAANRNIRGTPEQAEFKQVYSGLTKDIGNAARLNDLAAGPQPNNLGPTERAFNRGNKLYSAGMDRIDRVQPYANKDAPEQAYNGLMQSAKENVSTLRAVKKSVSEETRATVAATAIDRMGRAKPGQQNDTSDVWSQETFLTNWNQLTPKARMELFSGFKNAAQVSAQVDALAKGASMIRDSSKIWANPSGTGGNAMAAGSMGGIASTLLTKPLAAMGAVAGLMGARQASKNFLLSPKATDFYVQPTVPRNKLADLMLMNMNAQEANKR